MGSAAMVVLMVWDGVAVVPAAAPAPAVRFDVADSPGAAAAVRGHEAALGVALLAEVSLNVNVSVFGVQEMAALVS